MINESSEEIYAATGRRLEMRPLLPQRYHTVLEIGCNVGDFRQNFDKECEY